MDGMFSLVTALILLVVFVFLMRLLGAWMLRINEVIDELKKMNLKLTRIDDRVGNIQEDLYKQDKKESGLD
jgi:hypothetical protein